MVHHPYLFAAQRVCSLPCSHVWGCCRLVMSTRHDFIDRLRHLHPLPHFCHDLLNFPIYGEELGTCRKMSSPSRVAGDTYWTSSSAIAVQGRGQECGNRQHSARGLSAQKREAKAQDPQDGWVSFSQGHGSQQTTPQTMGGLAPYSHLYTFP